MTNTVGLISVILGFLLLSWFGVQRLIMRRNIIYRVIETIEESEAKKVKRDVALAALGLILLLIGVCLLLASNFIPK